MYNNKKIFTILVTYNPDIESLEKTIRKLSEQTDLIIICNNSNFDLTYHDKKNIKVFNFKENIGIAKAQSIGMKWAFKNGADFVLQMDQDSTPDQGMVSILYQTYIKLMKLNYNVGLVGPQDYDRFTKEINKARIKKGKSIKEDRNIYLVDSTLSSGSLIPKAAYEAVGGMLDELFIDVVDHEYCWRLIRSGFVVARDNRARLSHRLGDGGKKIFGLISVGVPAPFRHYYAFRNIIYLLSKNHPPIYWKTSSSVKLILKLIFYPLVLNHGFVRLKYMIKGIKDALGGKLGRIDENKTCMVGSNVS